MHTCTGQNIAGDIRNVPNDLRGTLGTMRRGQEAILPSNLDRFYKIGDQSFPSRDASVSPSFSYEFLSLHQDPGKRNDFVLKVSQLCLLVFFPKDQGTSESAQTSIHISLRTQLGLITTCMHYHGVLFLNLK